MSHFSRDEVTLDEFLGTYTVRQGGQAAGVDHPLASGYTVEITAHDSSTANVVIRDGEREISRQHYDFAHHVLQLVTTDSHGVPHHRQLSLMKLEGDPEGAYKCIYGVDIHGDPENVGTWGADDGPG